MEELKNQKDYIWMIRAFILLFLDIISILMAYLAALLLRFDFIFSRIPRQYLDGYIWSMPYWIIITIVVFYALRLYHSIWRFAGLDEAKRIVQAYIILIFLYGVGAFAMSLRMPRSYYLIGYVFSIIFTTGLRFSFRIVRSYTRNAGKNPDMVVDRVMVIGAGQSGQTLIKEMQSSSHLHSKVCCVIDDNPNKKGRLLEGVPIVGNRYDIEEKVKEYHITRIIYAIPATTGANRKAILNICKNTGCKMQTVPGVYQLLNGEVSVTKLRDVEITDLLGRAQVKVNNSEILKVLKDKVVMVTGGGGSIGSELCRQIAKSAPKLLIIFDIYENNAYAIQQELKRKHPELNFVTLIGSVRNTHRVDKIIETYRPDVIFHAAAHKHVPLMEESPNEAIKNNVEGTYKVAQSAARWNVKKFVLISTDKAVNPTNIMGASKRLCEMVVQMMNRQSDTDFVVVRFGNVLGSNGSVIPLFKKQIAEGGPVTVTDKRVIRYFMTIPEAVSLVLQAAYYAHGGEIFVLDMGDPVKIDDMARNLIRLSGYVPDEDIKIEYTGLRPGEKLYEELLMDEEGMQETDNELIFIGNPIEMDDEDFKRKLELLDVESRKESERIKEIVAQIVPTYHPDLKH